MFVTIGTSRASQSWLSQRLLGSLQGIKVLVSYWPIFSLSTVTVADVFAKFNSAQVSLLFLN